MKNVIRLSYVVLVGTIVLAGYAHLAAAFITILFSNLALKYLRIRGSKRIAVALFIVLVVAIFYVFFGIFVKEALKAFPHVAGVAIPAAVEYANEHGINLPFSDLQSFKVVMVGQIREQLGQLANFTTIATKEFAILIIGLVIAISIFINNQIDLDRLRYPIQNNFYSLLCDEISKRFGTFFHSFETVLGAQIIISAINTFFTSIFVFSVDLPYPTVIVVTTFVCGLLPIVGNLISNTIITAVALTISLQKAAFALVFLVVLHKLEYFLNSKIIGGRIRNPMWLTLLGLVLGEIFMGIPGMILAPVILHYLKVELARVEVKTV